MITARVAGSATRDEPVPFPARDAPRFAKRTNRKRGHAIQKMRPRSEIPPHRKCPTPTKVG